MLPGHAHLSGTQSLLPPRSKTKRCGKYGESKKSERQERIWRAEIPIAVSAGECQACFLCGSFEHKVRPCCKYSLHRYIYLAFPLCYVSRCEQKRDCPRNVKKQRLQRNRMKHLLPPQVSNKYQCGLFGRRLSLLRTREEEEQRKNEWRVLCMTQSHAHTTPWRP